MLYKRTNTLGKQDIEGLFDKLNQGQGEFAMCCKIEQHRKLTGLVCTYLMTVVVEIIRARNQDGMNFACWTSDRNERYLGKGHCQSNEKRHEANP